ncbi:MAG: TIGR01244 family phosphatase [Sphingomonadales bacterium]|nr:TIGR01244 family phosphatase [Sphingomonadales bacterium]MBD3774232.1 TIGR01244 family phosphatase [Paracoccaceae bacterium]
MTDYRQLTDTIFASPQIDPAELADAAAQGFTLVINNRPDGEDPAQPDSAEVEQAARAAGMDYLAIPITRAGFSEAQVSAMAEALGKASGKVLAFCRTGTRSTLLWALARSQAGDDPEATARAAAAAGYDVAPVRPAMDMLAGKAAG